MIVFASPKKQAPKGSIIINCTSISSDWGRNLSPMLSNSAPLNLYGYNIQTVENGWQYSRIYETHNDFAQWDIWRKEGYANPKGNRYPMGKGAKPLCSYICKTLGKLDWVESRKKIYLPLYFQKLERFCWEEIQKCIKLIESEPIVYLWDFDVSNDFASFDVALNNTNRSLGHGYLLVDYLARLTGKDFYKELSESSHFTGSTTNANDIISG